MFSKGLQSLCVGPVLASQLSAMILHSLTPLLFGTVAKDAGPEPSPCHTTDISGQDPWFTKGWLMLKVPLLDE